MTLSLAMIVKDEAAHLGHCLDSVRGLVDEMVVVDTGSTDGTQALAEGRGAKLSGFPWTGDFAAARNASLAQATGDWVLVLDADEAVDPADHPAIRAACEAPGAMAYQVLIRSYLPDGAYTLMESQAKANPGGYAEGAGFNHCGDTRGVRLFRRLPWVAFRGRIHETVEPGFRDRGLAVPPLDAVIHHYGFTLAARVEAKKPAYLELARRDAEDRPDDLASLFNLVIQAAAAGDWALAEASAGRYRAMARARNQPLPFTLVLTQGQALQRLDRPGPALEAFGEVLAADPGNVPAALGRGVSLARLGRREEARAVLESCIRAQPDYPTTYLDLADLLQGGGDPAAAEAVLRNGLAVSPADAALRARLIRLCLEAGALEQGVAEAWQAIQVCPGGGAGEWHQLVAAFLLRQGAAAEGREVLDLGLAAFPGHPGLARLRGAC